jgi:hypothetical protein
MLDERGRRALELAYRWFRRGNLEASHQQAWAFAQAHWEEFLAEFQEGERTVERVPDE